MVTGGEATALSQPFAVMAAVGEVADNRFAIFQKRPREVSTRETRFTQHRPTGDISNPQIEFVVSGTGDGWIDLSRSYFSLNVGMAQLIDNAPKPTDTPAQYPVFPIDRLARGTTFETNAAHLMWADVRLYLNGVDVSDENNDHYGVASFWRAAITKSGSYSRAGNMTTASTTYASTTYTRGAGIGGNIAGGNPISGVQSVISLALGGGATDGLITTSSSLNPDLPDSSKTDENFSDWTADFARGAKHRGISAPVEWTQLNSTAARPTTGFKFVPEIGMWQSGVLLPPNTDVRIVLKRARDALVVHSDVPISEGEGLVDATIGVAGTSADVDANLPDQYLPKILDWAGEAKPFSVSENKPSIVLNLLRVFPTEPMKQSLAAAIMERPATYNIIRQRVQAITFPGGAALDRVGLFSGVRPELVMVCIPTTKALEGEMALSPFRCSQELTKNAGRRQQYLMQKPQGRLSPGISDIWVSWGPRQIPIRPYSMETEQDKMRAYYEGYFQNSLAGENGAGDGPMLSYQDWKDNYTVFCFNTNESKAFPGVLAPPLADVGSLTLHIRFDETRPSDMPNTIFTMGFSGAIVTVDADRNVVRVGW